MNILIKNPRVLLYDGNAFYIKETDVVICGSKIASVGDTPEGFVPERVLNGRGKLVIPGLINAHTHNYMTLFRNLADDLPFDEWLFGSIQPKEDRLEAEDAYWGAMLAIMEQLSTGTTCFNDMNMHPNQTSRAAADSGIRAVLGRGLAGDIGTEGLERRIAEADDELGRWKGMERLTFTVCAHAPYSCSEGCLRLALQRAKEFGQHLHIHLSESEKEVADMRGRTGMSPIAYVDSLGLFEVPVIAAHCVWADEDDIRILAEKNVSVVTNPVSNMKLGNGFAPVPEMLDAGVRVALGTDGAASNNRLNMFNEMGVLCLIHKGTHKNAISIGAQDALRMATVDAAAALGLDDVGRIAPGMRADMAILSLDRPSMIPYNNIISSLAYSANGSEVEYTIVNGEIVYERGEFTRIDAERVYYEVKKRAGR